MRVHHEQAIETSFRYLERPDTDPRLRTVASSIIFDQGIEIGVMLQLLSDMDAPTVSADGTAMAWMGHAVEPSAMPGMATAEQLDELASASGADADELFVELMTAHHQGGIDMATDAASGVPTTTTSAGSPRRGPRTNSPRSSSWKALLETEPAGSSD